MLFLYDQCSHHGEDWSDIDTVILSVPRVQKGNWFCLYDPWSHRARVRSNIFNVSTKSQEKTTVVLYMINVPTLEEIGLVLILIEKIINAIYSITVRILEKSDLEIILPVQEHREDTGVVIYIMFLPRRR